MTCCIILTFVSAVLFFIGETFVVLSFALFTVRSQYPHGHTLIRSYKLDPLLIIEYIHVVAVGYCSVHCIYIYIYMHVGCSLTCEGLGMIKEVRLFSARMDQHAYIRLCFYICCARILYKLSPILYKYSMV